MQNSSFINSSFKRVVFSKLFHEQFAVYFTKQCYLALFFMQSNYHKHIQQMSCLSSVSQIQQLSTNRTTTNFQQSPEHLLPIFLPFSLHASITTISIVENQICSRCQRNFFFINFYFYQTNYYEVTVGLLTLFPSMASFFFQQLAQNKGPSHGFDVGEKKDPKFTNNPSVGA